MHRNESRKGFVSRRTQGKDGSYKITSSRENYYIMFKTITKIAAIAAMLAVVFTTASSAFAAGTFNDSSQGADCPTVTVARNGNAPTTGYGCWFTSDTAKVGDTVTFAIYYHNTSSSSVSGVSVYIDNPGTSAANSFTLNGGIKVNGSTVSTGSATISLDSSATLVPVRAQNEYNGGANPQSISVTQLMGSGYTVGTLGSGWSQQGVAKISFKVTGSDTCTSCNDQGQKPTVHTTPAQPVDSNNGNVTLNGYFNSNGYATTTSFQYRVNGGSWTTGIGSVSRGVSSGNFNYALTGLPGGTYTYEAVATNSYGTVFGEDQTFVIYGSTPVCGSGTTGSYPNCVPIQQYCTGNTTGVWPNCVPINNNQYCTGNTTGIWPNCVPIQQNCPSGTTGYYPNCTPIVQNCGTGTWNGSYCVYPTPTPVNQLPSISTLGTISIGGSVAVVDGYYNSTCSVSTYFNYGRTQALGQSTGTVNRGTGSGSMSQALQNLSPNTTYYYQAVGNNCAGTASGSIQSFTTSGTTVRDTTITRYVTVNTGNGGGSSFIKLMIDNHRDVVREGKDTAYDVSWTNLTGTKLNNLVLEVNFPSQMVITDTDRGAIETKKSSVVYQISSLDAHETGEMTISGQIDAGLKDGDPVVAQAVMAFENPKTTATENAIAYDADTFSIVDGSVLGASLFGLGFLPNSLAGWLIILLIILIIVLIARHYWRREAPTTMIVHNPAPAPTAPTPTIITGAPTGEYTVYHPTPKQ
ncbi:MAG: hypothetical protein JWM20_674 [Patescibacteria group bacterium]|nr:hypothetical protein [Patescibacteria group bacterium]